LNIQTPVFDDHRERRFENYSTQSIELIYEYLYDDFEKLDDNTGITVGCVNKKLSAGTRSYRRMEFQIKKIPK
jgi:hypothetical protein